MLLSGSVCQGGWQGLGAWRMADRLLMDLGENGLVTVGISPDGGLPETVSQEPLAWPLDAGALEDLRWYLEDYLRAPFGVWQERGPQIHARLAGWGEAVFASVFGSGPARDAYQRARDRRLELVFRSADPGLLALPWELMRDPAGPVALRLAGVSRAVPVADLAQTAAVSGGRLRMLVVISRPAGTGDIGYQMIARRLLGRLEAVRGQVDLVVLRPPTLAALRDALGEAVAAGEPFQVVHFDGHGALPGHRGSGSGPNGPPMTAGPAGEGVLAFEKPGGGSDDIPVSKVASVLAQAGVPVVVLNACQSGAVGKDLEAAVATRLLREGCAAVVAMAYSVYAVAAAEFMAVFYEHLFAGDSLSAAVTAGRRRLFEEDGRPSPKGELPLADWLVPVHYLRRDVAFPQARTSRPQGEPSLEALLDELRASSGGRAGGPGGLDPVGVFVGRDDLFFELEAAARLSKVVVLHGQGGTGKTELAKAFGRWWRDTGGVDKPDWVLWHSFEPGVASFGLDGVITETGLAVFGASFARLGQEERLRVVEGLLAQRRLLLIWDNFETVHSMPDPGRASAPLDDADCAKVKGFLARLAAHGRSTLIITSRTAEDWLDPIRRISVGGLAPDEAVQYADWLLAPYPAAVVSQRRARRAFGELLEWLNGHPLSMRLILPRLDTAEPEALLDGLRGTTPLFSGDAGGDRGTSLAASITYSFTHLTSATRRLLPAVCLFHGVTHVGVLAIFSGEPGAPRRFAGASVQDWTQALDDATRVGLLTPLGSGLYGVHPALPAYLAAGWRAEDPDGHDSVRDAATRALATAYVPFAAWLDQEIGSGDAGLAYAIIGLQQRTLGALLGYALDHQLWEQARAIAQPLTYYWNVRGLIEEAATWTDRVHIATGDSDPPRLDTPAGRLWLFITGEQAGRQQRAGRLDDAERTYRQILDILQAQPASSQQQSHIATACRNLGRVAHDRGRLEDAEDWYRKSLAIEEGFRNRPGMASTYHQLGIVAQDQGLLEDAQDWHRKSLDTYEDLGNQPGMADSYHQLGRIAQLWRRFGEAEDWCRKSLAIKEALGDRRGMAAGYHQLGWLAQDRGQLEDAEDWYRMCLAIDEDLGDRPGMAACYHQLGWLAQLGGRLGEAEDWYRKSLAIYEDLGDLLHMASSYHQLGMLAQDQGRPGEAQDWYRKSLTINQDLGNRPGMALTLAQLGRLSDEQGQPGQALELAVRCVTLFDEFPHPSTGTGPLDLARLTAQLGIDALKASWRKVTGSPLPQAVRDHITSNPPTG
jgi:tetratricopeptide (TPR) repeat protein